MAATIVNHFFHGLYLFDYLSKEFEKGSPKYLYADWPIINCVPKTKENTGGGSFVKFESKEDTREIIYPDESEESKKIDLKNYIIVKLQDLGKFRCLFHNLIKSHGFEHNFNFTIQGDTKGPVNRTCCIPSPVSFTAKYDGKDGMGGHCCDRAKFSFSAAGNKLGTINLNNASDCGSRESGPFTLSKEQVEKALVDDKIEVELTAQVDNPHNSVTVIEVKDTESDTVISNVGISEGVSMIKACSQPKDDYSDELCCCPPKYRKTGSDGKTSSQFATGYSCERTHSKKITGSLKVDTEKIFNESSLKNRISPTSLSYYYGSTGDPESSSSSSTLDKSETLHVNSLIIYKDDWKFDEKEFKKLFEGNGEGGNKKQFPFDSTLINDPILVPLYAKSSLQTDNLVRFVYQIKDRPTKKEQEDISVTSNRDFKSEKLGKVSLKTDQSNLGAANVDMTSYVSNYILRSPFYIESTKEYIFYVDLEAYLRSNNNYGIWDAGDYEAAGLKSKDGKKNFELFAFSYKVDGSKQTASSILMSEGQILSTQQIHHVLEDFQPEEKEKKLKKLQLPLLIKTDAKEEKLTFECLRFEVQSLKAVYNRSSSSSSGEERVCLDGTINANWNLDDFKLRVNGWLEGDFSESTTFPPPVA